MILYLLLLSVSADNESSPDWRTYAVKDGIGQPAGFRYHRDGDGLETAVAKVREALEQDQANAANTASALAAANLANQTKDEEIAARRERSAQRKQEIDVLIKRVKAMTVEKAMDSISMECAIEQLQEVEDVLQGLIPAYKDHGQPVALLEQVLSTVKGELSSVQNGSVRKKIFLTPTDIAQLDSGSAEEKELAKEARELQTGFNLRRRAIWQDLASKVA